MRWVSARLCRCVASLSYSGLLALRLLYHGIFFLSSMLPLFIQSNAASLSVWLRYLLSQVMALIAYLMEFKGNYGPHLIIVPNAVLVNWKVRLPCHFKLWAIFLLSISRYCICCRNLKFAVISVLGSEWTAKLVTISILHILCWCKGPKAEAVLSSKLPFLLVAFHMSSLYLHFILAKLLISCEQTQSIPMTCPAIA